MFIKTKDGQLDRYPYTVGDLRRDNPNISFPKQIPTEMLARYNVYPVTRLSVPEFDSLVQSLVMSTTPTEDAGQWTIGYDVVQKPEEMAANNIRRERDRFLSECDWITLRAADTNTAVDAAWATYRQALRDVTAQDGFPYTIEWPTKP